METQDYQKNALEFAKKHKITLKVIGKPEYRKYFIDDKDSRFVFKLKLNRNGKSYTFNFGQSIASGSKVPTMYDILSTLEKYDIGDFENFCNEFGYDYDSISSLKTYKAVVKEFNSVERLFGDIIEELQEIQ